MPCACACTSVGLRTRERPHRVLVGRAPEGSSSAARLLRPVRARQLRARDRRRPGRPAARQPAAVATRRSRRALRRGRPGVPAAGLGASAVRALLRRRPDARPQFRESLSDAGRPRGDRVPSRDGVRGPARRRRDRRRAGRRSTTPAEAATASCSAVRSGPRPPRTCASSSRSAEAHQKARDQETAGPQSPRGESQPVCGIAVSLDVVPRVDQHEVQTPAPGTLHDAAEGPVPGDGNGELAGTDVTHQANGARHGPARGRVGAGRGRRGRHRSAGRSAAADARRHVRRRRDDSGAGAGSAVATARRPRASRRVAPRRRARRRGCFEAVVVSSCCA